MYSLGTREKKSTAPVHKLRCTLAHHIEAIEVVEVSMFPVAVYRVFVHGDLRAVEHGRLVHIVPRVQVLH